MRSPERIPATLGSERDRATKDPPNIMSALEDVHRHGPDGGSRRSS
jgi:hypothetical protein